MHSILLDHAFLPRHALHEEGVQYGPVAPRQLRINCFEPGDISGVEIGRGAHPGDQHLDVAPVELRHDCLQIGPRQRRVQAPEHVVGAKFQDDQVGLARQAVERPSEPGLPRFAGVPRHAAIRHFGRNPVTAKRRLKLGREAKSRIQPVPSGQAVPERQDQRTVRRGRGSGKKDRQKGGGNRPADHGLQGGAIVTGPQGS